MIWCGSRLSPSTRRATGTQAQADELDERRDLGLDYSPHKSWRRGDLLSSVVDSLSAANGPSSGQHLLPLPHPEEEFVLNHHLTQTLSHQKEAEQGQLAEVFVRHDV